MKKLISIMFISILLISFAGCSSGKTETKEIITKSNIEIARENVINKYKNEADEFGTSKYIEDIYKLYPNDSTIANIYYYCIAKEQYGYYEKLDENKYFENAKEYALKIDPDYDGEFSEEMHDFVNKICPDENIYYEYENASSNEYNYNNLTNSEKKAICEYIQSRYDYYDSINGGYSGDKYSDTIMQEAANKYGLTVNQIDIIWMNYYSY